jgi:tRNA 2-thiouridine synthesizing protein E
VSTLASADGADIVCDAEGYLCKLDDWSPAVAAALAAEHGITLSPPHWDALNALREFHAQFGLSPAMRPLCKYLKEKNGPERATSIYLLQLFPPRPDRPESPAKVAARIAGLPRPENCL